LHDLIQIARQNQKGKYNFLSLSIIIII